MIFECQLLKENLVSRLEMTISSCVTGSYDRTVRIWDIETGLESFVLNGHQNAVFAVQYNYPIWYVQI